MTSADQSSATMRIIESPASNDVICGKDKTFNRNIGNMIYRQLIVSTAPRYAKIKTKPEKMKITAHIVHTMIHQHNSRFLKQVMHNDEDEDEDGTVGNGDYYWQEISITAARDKTSHALRFCASQMHLHQTTTDTNATVMYEYDHDETATSTTCTIPITPPIERRSIRGRVQRKSKRYSPSSVTPRTIPTKRSNPLRHRRTVSRENMAVAAMTTTTPMVVTSSIDPNNFYNNHHHYHQNDYQHHCHHNYQYYQPTYHHHERQHQYHPHNSDGPVPLECSSSSAFDDHTYRNNFNYDKMQSTRPAKQDCHYLASATSTVTKRYKNDSTNEKSDNNDDDDDLDAILREPIQWDDDDGDDANDEDEVKKVLFQL